MRRRGWRCGCAVPAVQIGKSGSPQLLVQILNGTELNPEFLEQMEAVAPKSVPKIFSGFFRAELTCSTPLSVDWGGLQPGHAALLLCWVEAHVATKGEMRGREGEGGGAMPVSGAQCRSV